jgi:hypothetical protein
LRKIALIGSAPSSVTRAPYDDPSWSIWGCSPGAIVHMKRISCFFEMHRFVDPNPCHEINYIKRLAALTVPVYMVHPSPEVPASVTYPKETVLDFVWGHVLDLHGRKRSARFNPNDFTSSLAWMLALAIVELANEPGQNEIGLWGVDMSAQEEYGGQRDGCLSLIHIAKSIGIRITLPPESDLIRPAPLYGYQECDHSWIKHNERDKEIQARLADARRRTQAALEETRFLEGALDSNTYESRTWVGDGQALRMMYSQPDLIEDLAKGEFKSADLAPCLPKAGLDREYTAAPSFDPPRLTNGAGEQHRLLSDESPLDREQLAAME